MKANDSLWQSHLQLQPTIARESNRNLNGNRERNRNFNRKAHRQKMTVTVG